MQFILVILSLGILLGMLWLQFKVIKFCFGIVARVFGYVPKAEVLDEENNW